MRSIFWCPRRGTVQKQRLKSPKSSVYNLPLVLMKNAESLHGRSLALASPSVRKQADKMKEGRNDGQKKSKVMMLVESHNADICVSKSSKSSPLQSNQMFSIIRWTVAAHLMLLAELPSHSALIGLPSICTHLFHWLNITQSLSSVSAHDARAKLSTQLYPQLSPIFRHSLTGQILLGPETL